MDLDEALPQDFGDYFVIIQDENGNEERLKALSIRSVQFTRLRDSVEVNGHFDRAVNYTCADCELTDIICRGESMMPTGRINIIPITKIVNFNFPGFEDSNSCVFMAMFKVGNTNYTKVIGILENNLVTIDKVPLVKPPVAGEQFEQEVHFSCQGDCIIEKIYVNSVPVENTVRRNGGAFAYYLLSGNTITIRITEYSQAYEGVFQAVFMVEGTAVTKTIMEIGDKVDEDTKVPAETGCSSEAETSGGDTTSSGKDSDNAGAASTLAGGDAPPTDSSGQPAGGDEEPTSEGGEAEETTEGA